MKIVKIHLLNQSEPIIRYKVFNTYTKDGLYCVMNVGGPVEKYPIVHIFRISEKG